MLKKVVITDEQLSEITNLKYLSHGSFADIYETEDYIVKLFYDVIESKHFHDGETFVEFESRLIHTPAILLLSEEGDIIGYARKKIKGLTLEEIILYGLKNKEFDISLDDLLKLVEDLKVEIEYASNKGVVMYDVSCANIVLNDDMHIIDTDGFYYYDISKEALYKMNCETVEETIIECFSSLDSNLTDKILEDIAEEYNDGDQLYKFVDAAKKYKTKSGTYIKSLKDFCKRV